MSLAMFKLDGRVALITGGNRGLGFAMALALAEAGADVVVTSRQQEKALKSATTLAEVTGRRALGLVVDATDAQQVESMVQLYWLHGTSVQKKTDLASRITLFPCDATRSWDKGNVFFSPSSEKKTPSGKQNRYLLAAWAPG